MTKSKKKPVMIILSLLLIIYLAGSIYFNYYSFPNTEVNGEDKSLMKKEDILNPSSESYILNIKGRDNKEFELKSEDINLEFLIVGEPNFNQNNWLWPIEVFKKHEQSFDLRSEYNSNKLVDLVEKSDLFNNITEPVDAHVEKTDEGYVIKEEVKGNKLDEEQVLISISEALEKSQKELILKDEYINPKLYANDEKLKDNVDKMNQIFNSSYLFDFVDRKWELKGDELLAMFDEKDNEYVLNEDKLYNYIKDIAIETDTYNTPHQFNATGIGEITVPGGIYGWQMNVSDTMENVLEMINEKKDGSVEIEYNQEALHREIDDIGNTYIEIDLSRQHMWFYKDGELVVDTPVVTGHAVRHAATPTGVNKVWSKEEGKSLVGENALSGVPYTYPVKYWIPVGWTGSGIHDSHDRVQFGGDIYKHAGSSSCINTPEDAMRRIFESVPINTAVVIYESTTNYSPTEFEKQEMQRD